MKFLEKWQKLLYFVMLFSQSYSVINKFGLQAKENFGELLSLRDSLTAGKHPNVDWSQKNMFFIIQLSTKLFLVAWK